MIRVPVTVPVTLPVFGLTSEEITDLARAAYIAYRNHQRRYGVTVLDEWAKLPPEQVGAWRAAVADVALILRFKTL